MASPPAGPYPVPPKKTSPLVWIIVAILGLVMIAGIVVIAGGFFVAKKLQDAYSNPALATAKVLAAANPDIDIISTDDSKGTVTFKDKKSGKVVTLNFDQIKQGKITFEEDGKSVTMNSGADGVRIAGSDGSKVEIGANAAMKLPDWLPAYPGATAQSNFSMQSDKEAGASVSFTTKDSVDKVSKFYEEAFKKAGLTTTTNLMQQDGKAAGGMVAAESADKKRSAMVNIGAGEDAVTVGVTYSDKK